MNLRFCISIVCAACVSYAACCAPRSWECVAQPSVFERPAEVMQAAEGPDVRVADGYIYISLKQPANVALFTILGQLIVSQHLKPGYYRFKTGTRGVFLLKAGSATRRVTL